MFLSDVYVLYNMGSLIGMLSNDSSQCISLAFIRSLRLICFIYIFIFIFISIYLQVKMF